MTTRSDDQVKPPKEKHLRGGSFGGITYEKLLASQDTLTLREEIDLRDWLVARQFEMGIIRDELLTKWAAQPNRAQRTFVEDTDSDDDKVISVSTTGTRDTFVVSMKPKWHRGLLGSPKEDTANERSKLSARKTPFLAPNPGDSGSGSGSDSANNGESFGEPTVSSLRPSIANASSSTDEGFDRFRNRTDRNVSTHTSRIRPPCIFVPRRYIAGSSTSSSQLSAGSSSFGFPSMSSFTESPGSSRAMVHQTRFGRVTRARKSSTTKLPTTKHESVTDKGGGGGTNIGVKTTYPKKSADVAPNATSRIRRSTASTRAKNSRRYSAMETDSSSICQSSRVRSITTKGTRVKKWGRPFMISRRRPSGAPHTMASAGAVVFGAHSSEAVSTDCIKPARMKATGTSLRKSRKSNKTNANKKSNIKQSESPSSNTPDTATTPPRTSLSAADCLLIFGSSESEGDDDAREEGFSETSPDPASSPYGISRHGSYASSSLVSSVGRWTASSSAAVGDSSVSGRYFNMTSPPVTGSVHPTLTSSEKRHGRSSNSRTSSSTINSNIPKNGSSYTASETLLVAATSRTHFSWNTTCTGTGRSDGCNDEVDSQDGTHMEFLNRDCCQPFELLKINDKERIQKEDVLFQSNVEEANTGLSRAPYCCPCNISPAALSRKASFVGASASSSNVAMDSGFDISSGRSMTYGQTGGDNEANDDIFLEETTDDMTASPYRFCNLYWGVGFARYVAALGPARAEMADAMGQLLGQKHAALKKNKDSLKRETALEMIAREELAQALTALRQNEDELTLARVKFDSLCDYTKQRVMEATAKAEEKVWRLGEKLERCQRRRELVVIMLGRQGELKKEVNKTVEGLQKKLSEAKADNMVNMEKLMEAVKAGEKAKAVLKTQKDQLKVKEALILSLGSRLADADTTSKEAGKAIIDLKFRLTEVQAEAKAVGVQDAVTDAQPMVKEETKEVTAGKSEEDKEAMTFIHTIEGRKMEEDTLTRLDEPLTDEKTRTAKARIYIADLQTRLAAEHARAMPAESRALAAESKMVEVESRAMAMKAQSLANKKSAEMAAKEAANVVEGQVALTKVTEEHLAVKEALICRLDDHLTDEKTRATEATSAVAELGIRLADWKAQATTTESRATATEEVVMEVESRATAAAKNMTERTVEETVDVVGSQESLLQQTDDRRIEAEAKIADLESRLTVAQARLTQSDLAVAVEAENAREEFRDEIARLRNRVAELENGVSHDSKSQTRKEAHGVEIVHLSAVASKEENGSDVAEVWSNNAIAIVESTTEVDNPDTKMKMENMEEESTAKDNPPGQHHGSNSLIRRLTDARVARLEGRIVCLKKKLVTAEEKSVSEEKACQRAQAELQNAKKAAVKGHIIGVRERAVLVEDLGRIVDIGTKNIRSSITAEFESLQLLLDQQHKAQLAVVKERSTEEAKDIVASLMRRISILEENESERSNKSASEDKGRVESGLGIAIEREENKACTSSTESESEKPRGKSSMPPRVNRRSLTKALTPTLSEVCFDDGEQSTEEIRRRNRAEDFRFSDEERERFLNSVVEGAAVAVRGSVGLFTGSP